MPFEPIQPVRHYKFYTDGACSGNPGPGGWAVVLEPEGPNDPVTEYAAWRHEDGDTTNNRMELRALVYAIDVADWRCKNPGDKVTVYSDSLYCINCATGKWKRKTHTDLWQIFDIFYDSLKLRNISVEFQWVKGHNGDRLNILADELAKAVITTKINSTI